jgi:hypothetical protein
MDVEIEEMNASVSILDMKALKAEVIAAVLEHLADAKRLEARRDADRKVAGNSKRYGGTI